MAEVTRKHRELALRQWPEISWRNLVGDVGQWLESGRDLGPFNLLTGFSQALADIEAEALARAAELEDMLCDTHAALRSRPPTPLADLETKFAAADAAGVRLRLDPAKLDALQAKIAAERATLGAAPQPVKAPTHSESNGEAGDYSEVCDHCGEAVSEPHSFAECATGMRKSIDALWRRVGQLEDEARSQPVKAEQDERALAHLLEGARLLREVFTLYGGAIGPTVNQRAARAWLEAERARLSAHVEPGADAEEGRR